MIFTDFAQYNSSLTRSIYLLPVITKIPIPPVILNVDL